MIRPATVRSALLLLTVSAAACNSGAENTQPTANTIPTNTTSTPPVATPNQTVVVPAKAKLNLNTASEDEFLNGVPGLDNRMAHEFEEYRPYRSIGQFRREMGKYVKADKIAEYEKYVYVPIAINESDAATLQQIPGLDAAEAEALVAARPFASTDAFLVRLAGNVSEAELAIAKTYFGNQ